ncbi:MAG: pyridoxamine 5'-phosphate oxidase family protein [Mariprofundaceae bacterium]|nr:pyridoxamine 5'-phosphate oxidase family protein [Mariprofundaceae bacterium]
MGEKYSEISEKHESFIEKQKIFFVGTATADSRINISPKGLDSLRVLSPNRVLWLNITGSGNETAAHLQSDERMTVMFNAFTGPPMILRLYGQAKMVLTSDLQWDALYGLFEPIAGARQIFDMHVDLVHTSCGFGVPLYDYQGERTQLQAWAEHKGEAGVKQYWQDKNTLSLDGEAIPIGDD